MSKPKLKGRRPHLGPAEVGIGLHKLPGECFLMDPSMIKTSSSAKDDMIPSNEVMDKNRSGIRVVGNMLLFEVVPGSKLS